MKTLLVPTDFSEGSLNAVNFALEIAAKITAKLVLLHAYSMPSGGSSVMVDISDILKNQAEEDLAHFRTKLEKSPWGTSHISDYKIVYGGLLDAVNHTAKEVNADMIVMGTVGASGFERVLGSNAAALARESNLPVLAVPPGFSPDLLDHLLVLTDYRPIKHDHTLAPLATIAQAFNSKVDVVHVYTGKAVDDTTANDYQKRLQSRVSGAQTTFHSIEAENAEDGFLEAINQSNPDLVCVVRHNRAFWEGIFHRSVTRALLLNAKKPVLVLQD